MNYKEGSVIYLLPTGNNVRRDVHEQEIKSATILKVARVFITLLIGKRELKFRHNGIYLDGGFNSGYIAFGSQKDVDDYYEVKALSRKIYSRFTYTVDYESIGLEKLRLIAEILGINSSEVEQ